VWVMVGHEALEIGCSGIESGYSVARRWPKTVEWQYTCSLHAHVRLQYECTVTLADARQR
jgi:hypothetical protein